MADYPSLVAPLIPNGNDSKGPELFLQGAHIGLAAAAQLSQLKRESDMEMVKLAQQERMSQEQHALELKKIEAEAPMYEAHAKYFGALQDLSTAKATAYANNTATAAQRAIAFNQQRQDLVNDVNDQADKLKLNDPDFATKRPVQFAANVMKFRDEFAFSPLPEVKNAITQFQRIADQQKIPLKLGATFDETKGADGEWIGGKTQMVPLWQIVRSIQDPARQEDTMNALQASGHVQIIKGVQEILGKKVPTTTTQLTPALKSLMDEGKGVDFSHVPSRVPSAMLPKSSAAGTAPTALPDAQAPDAIDYSSDSTPPPDTNPQPQASNASPQFDPTETDIYLQHAKNAIAQGAPAAVVAQRLQQDYGIDPSDLWANS
jgi:hypothetical protein